MTKPVGAIRILHISDLHIGQESAANVWRMRRVLGDAWARNLRDVAQAGQVDLVCFTGDLAFSGQPAQYEDATAFVDQVLAALGLPRERFFCVPGNHDVDRKLNADAWASLREAAGHLGARALSPWLAGGRPAFRCEAGWPAAVLARQQAYHHWLRTLGRPELLPGTHPLLGYRQTVEVAGRRLHLVGLDSAWLAGDGQDRGQLLLTEDQIGRLLTEAGQPLQAPTVVLMHHPLDWLADARDARSLLAEHQPVLLLHGHLHDPEIERWSTPDQQLAVSAAGCLYESTRYPNSFQVLDLLPDGQGRLAPQAVWFRSWSGRFWHDDNSRYEGSVDGRMLLAPTTPAMPFVGGQFIGRGDELRALCAALLPGGTAAPRPTVICCAIEGMPGVGKTRLAEAFIDQHWLPALGRPAGSDPAEVVLRHVLDPHSAAAPSSAEALAQTLCDRLRISPAPQGLMARLAAALRAGPRLLLIENVDTPALAEVVGALVNQLPQCPLIVTARYQRLGDASWARIPVEPMPLDEACELLAQETAALGGTVSTPDARTLAEQLGRLPLALHIAASHLGTGWSAAGFLQALRGKGLDLAPAQPGDRRLSADRARAILKSSFEISWQSWLQQQGPERAGALALLAHGPATDLGESLASAITGLGEDFEAWALSAWRLSLLQRLDAPRRWQLHPLVAEYLQPHQADAAPLVMERQTTWFTERLPKTDDERQQRRWGELWQEQAALAQWLALLPLAEIPRIERLGATAALRVGPFSAWIRLCQRGLDDSETAAAHGSNLWWTLGQAASFSGQPDLALAAAQAKAELDQLSGNDHEHSLARSLAADVLQARGDLDEALRIRREEELPVYERLGDQRSRAVTMGKIADVLQACGDLDEALRIRREEELPVYERLGDQRSRAVAMGKIADVLQARGDLDEALRIRREEELPVFERLGDQRSRAVTMGKIADFLQDCGDLNEALRIRREEELPVYERLGDRRERAVTMSKIADVLQACGDFDETLRIRREEELPVYERLGDQRLRAVTMGKIADVLQARGDLDGALRIRREEELPVYERLGDQRERAVTMGKIADVLQARGDLDGALRIRREEELPVFERLDDQHARAVTMGKIADVLQARGDLDDALRIRREEELPVYERLGDQRERAVTMGKMADVLQARGDLDGALRIRREEELPVYERLGDQRERAVTMGKIADVLQARGDLDGALRIRREQQLPVFERLGDQRERAVTMGKIADVLQARGDLDDALRIRHEEQLPVYDRLGDQRARAVTMGKIADVMQARGDLDGALRIRCEEELPVFERLGDQRERAVTMGKIAGVLQARGDIDEALRIRREEQLPVFERLGDRRGALVTKTNMAIGLLARERRADRAEAKALLAAARASAEAMGLPEARQISAIEHRAFGGEPPGDDEAPVRTDS